LIKETILKPQWFEKVNESQLSGSDRDKFNFQKDTVSLIRKIKKEATTYFKVVNSHTVRKPNIIWVYGL
jgi:hypothetical protein